MRKSLIALLLSAVPPLVCLGGPVQVTAAEAQAAPLIPIERATALVLDRYAGTIIAVDVQPGKFMDHQTVIYAFRLLTARGDIIAVDVDAVAGRIVETDGRGLVPARRQP